MLSFIDSKTIITQKILNIKTVNDVIESLNIIKSLLTYN